MTIHAEPCMHNLKFHQHTAAVQAKANVTVLNTLMCKALDHPILQPLVDLGNMFTNGCICMCLVVLCSYLEYLKTPSSVCSYMVLQAN